MTTSENSTDTPYANLTIALERLLDAAAACEIAIVEIKLCYVKDNNRMSVLDAVRKNQNEGDIITHRDDSEEPFYCVSACLQTGYD